MASNIFGTQGATPTPSPAPTPTPTPTPAPASPFGDLNTESARNIQMAQLVSRKLDEVMALADRDPQAAFAELDNLEAAIRAGERQGLLVGTGFWLNDITKLREALSKQRTRRMF